MGATELRQARRPRARDGVAGADLDDLDADEIAVIMDHAFERYVGTAGLFGTPESCLATVDRLRELGVDEIACLIDFGVDDDVGARRARPPRRAAPDEQPAPTVDDADREPPSTSRRRCDDELDYGLVAQAERHGVTHLQCTPSMAAVVAADPAGLARSPR